MSETTQTQFGGRQREVFTRRCFKPIGIELLRTPDGVLWAGDLWFKDLAYHLSYLPATTLLSPVRAVDVAPVGWSPMVGKPFQSLEVLEAPNAGSLKSALRQLPQLWRQITVGLSRSEVVYCGFVEWPIPYGWLVAPRLMLSGSHKPLFTFLESTFWRPSAGVTFSRKRRLRGWLSERITRFCLRRIDLAFVTQPAYGEMVPAGRGTIVEVNASWIERDWIVSSNELDDRLERRAADPTLRVLFAGRLEQEKGLGVLLDAIRALAESGESVRFDLVGAGALAPEARAFAEGASDLVRVVDPVPYGPEFVTLIAEADVVVIPSLSSEQPRLVYDAYSQGVPVLAAATSGLLACVSESTGWLFQPGRSDELADQIRTIVRERDSLRTLGAAAVLKASGLTHADTHRVRYEAFTDLFAGRASDRGATSPGLPVSPERASVG